MKYWATHNMALGGGGIDQDDLLGLGNGGRMG